MTRDGKLKALFGFLVVSGASARSIPFELPWGVDLQNLHAYQRCAAERNPYFLHAVKCGDLANREMIYPPLLFRSFFWLRHLSLESAMLCWCSAALVMLAAAYYVWVRIAEREDHAAPTWETVIYCGLLGLQYPMIFLLERGGTDTVPVILWAIAAYLFCRSKIGLSGAVAGAAVAFKLYPAIPLFVVSVALLADRWRDSSFEKNDYVRFGVSATSVFIGLNLLFPAEAFTYYTTILPTFSATLTQVGNCMHSLVSTAGPDHSLYPKLILVLFLALWCWSASRSLARRPGMTFAGLFAISTYFTATSWDYNLVTTYPLLLLLFFEARRTDRWSTLVLGLVAIVGDRKIFDATVFNFLDVHIHLALQFAWLVWVAIDLAMGHESEREHATR